MDETSYRHEWGRALKFPIEITKEYVIIFLAITIDISEPCQDRKVAALRIPVYV